MSADDEPVPVIYPMAVDGRYISGTSSPGYVLIHMEFLQRILVILRRLSEDATLEHLFPSEQELVQSEAASLILTLDQIIHTIQVRTLGLRLYSQASDPLRISRRNNQPATQQPEHEENREWPLDQTFDPASRPNAETATPPLLNTRMRGMAEGIESITTESNSITAPSAESMLPSQAQQPPPERRSNHDQRTTPNSSQA